MVAETKKAWLQLTAALVLAVMLFTACASGGTKAAEKIELGQKYLTELNYAEAVAAFTEVIELDPSNIEAYAGRAEAYKGLKQYDEAKADYTTVIEKAADLPYTQAQAYAGRAEVYELTDEDTAAESDYSAAMGLLEQDDIGQKENIAEKLIRELKIRVLQLHAEICMKLGLYDQAMEDYAKLAELGVSMAEDENAEQPQETASADGAYVWNYTDEEGNAINVLLTVQAGRSQMDAVVNYPSSQEIAGIIASYKMMKDYPEMMEAAQEFQKLEEENSRLAESIDPNHVTEAQMNQLEAFAARWEALEAKYSGAAQKYEADMEKYQSIDWKPQLVEKLTLSNPVSRVEKTADTLYVYVPTGTKYVSADLVFTSYSGTSETVDAMTFGNGKNDLSQPVYEWDTSSDTAASFKVEYREAK